jgi:hypothetical protein
MLFTPLASLIVAFAILQRYQSRSHSVTSSNSPQAFRLSSSPGLFQNIGNTSISRNLLVDDNGIEVADFSISLASITYLTGLQSSPRLILIRKIFGNGSTAWQRSFGQPSAENNGALLWLEWKREFFYVEQWHDIE